MIRSNSCSGRSAPGGARRFFRARSLASRTGYLVVAISGTAASASAQTAGRSVPDVTLDGAVPCASGVISSIDVDSRSIYDPRSTSIAPLAWTYRALNLLHVNTSPSFIRGELLFKEGDCFDPFLMSESYRLLDQHGFMYVEEMTDEPDGNGGRRVHVATRDEWSTKVDIGPTYDNGVNLERFQVTEENLLGQGVFGEYTYYARRETRIQSFGARTPRFFGRSDAGIGGGNSRAGHFFEQYWRYPFVGDAGRVAVREGFSRGTDFFAYQADPSLPYVQVLVPLRREQLELSGAYRFGRPGALWIVGGSLTREVVDFPRRPEVTTGDFDVRHSLPTAPPPEITRQLQPYSATRASLHFGARRLRYEEYVGLDALREPNLTGLGLFAGVTVGHSLGLMVPARAPEQKGLFARSHLSWTQPVGISLLRVSGTLEGRRGQGAWRDLLGDADFVFYGRTAALRDHTVFFRAATAGGWRTSLPLQISLGGREGVRSLDEDRFPGGRMVRFTLEDRIAFPWPSNTADLGMTLFSDLGQVWAGDAPYGADSGWQAALGVGLRVGLPRNTRHIWRLDIAFPVGPSDGGPIFRASGELNLLRSGFSTPDVERSRRFSLGAESF